MRQISPERVLATKRQARISNDGFSKVNSLVKSAVGTPLGSKYKIDKARKELESKIDYQINELEDVTLVSVEETMTERRRRLQMEDSSGFEVVFSLDKGRGRVVSTLSHVYHPRPCSYYNHLPIQSWSGPDNHDALMQRDIG